MRAGHPTPGHIRFLRIAYRLGQVRSARRLLTSVRNPVLPTWMRFLMLLALAARVLTQFSRGREALDAQAAAHRSPNGGV